MDFDYKTTPFLQVQDSTQTESSASFAPLNQQGFGSQQPSMLSAGFENNSLDSLVKVKTRSRRVRKKKVIKSYKVQESVLLVQKDTFAFLKSSANPELTVYNIEDHLPAQPKYQEKLIQIPSDTIAVSNVVDTTNLLVEAPTDSVVVDSTELNHITIAGSDSLQQSDTLLLQAEDTLKPIVAADITEDKQEVIEVVEPESSNNLRVFENLRGEIWLMAFLVVLLFILAFIRLQFNSKLKNYTQALFSYQQYRKTYREQNSTSLRLGIFLSVVFYFSAALIAYYSYFHFFDKIFDLNGFVLTTIFAFAFLSYNTIFAIVNKILGHLFEGYDIVNEYLHNIFFINRLLGLILVPILIIYPYVSFEAGFFLLWAAYILIALSYLIRWFRGIQISFTHRLPYFYMILYLCSLEIIPLMLITKLILSVD